MHLGWGRTEPNLRILGADGVSMNQHNRAVKVGLPFFKCLASSCLTKEFLPLFVYGAIVLVGFRFFAPILANLDNGVFLPISYYLENTSELRPYWFDSLRRGIFNWHGFVYPVLLSYFSFGNDWNDIQLAVVFLSYLTFVAVLMVSFILPLPLIARISVAIVTVSLLLDYRGRPETVGLLILTSILLLHYKLPSFGSHSNVAGVAAGLLYGCLLYSHPALFMMSIPSYGLYVAYRLYGQRKVVARLIVYILLFVIGFLVASAFLQATMYPEPLMVWYQGIFRLGGDLADWAPSYTQNYAKYFIFSRNLPFLIFQIGLVACLLVFITQKVVLVKNNTIWWKLITCVSMVTACYFYFRLGIKIPSKYYNITGLTAPSMIILYALYFSKPNIEPGALGASQNVSFLNSLMQLSFDKGFFGGFWECIQNKFNEWGFQKSAVFLLLMLVTGSSVGGQGLWIAQWSMEVGKVSYYNNLLRERIASFSNYDFQICTDSAGLTASPDFATSLEIKMAKPWTPEEKSPDPGFCDVYIRVQAQRNLSTPGDIEGFTLIEDHFLPSDRYPVRMRPFHLAYALFLSDSNTKPLPDDIRVIIDKER